MPPLRVGLRKERASGARFLHRRLRALQRAQLYRPEQV